MSIRASRVDHRRMEDGYEHQSQWSVRKGSHSLKYCESLRRAANILGPAGYTMGYFGLQIVQSFILFNTLPTNEVYLHRETFSFMIYPAMPLGDRFCVSREDESRWVHLKGANSMALSGLGRERPLVGAGQAISLVLSVNGPRKQSFHLVFWLSTVLCPVWVMETKSRVYLNPLVPTL